MAQQGGNPIELYEAAAQGFRKTLSGVGLNQMGDPTPCTEWNVQALINHNLKVAGFVAGVYRENITVSPLDVGGPLPEGDALELLDAGIGNVLEVCHNAFAPMMEHMREEEFGGGKIMGPEVQVPASASLQDRFLGIMGRQP